MANDFEKYNIRPSKKLGQNFLIDKNIAANIASRISSPKNKILLEIGSGLGGLTEFLLKLEPKRLIAVEYDRGCIPYLHDLKMHFNELDVVAEDALTIDERALTQEPFIIVSNLPYNISVVLLIKWLDIITSIDHMVLMFQKEVADRILAQPGSKTYGVVSVFVQYLCDVTKCFDVSPSAFFPAPTIMSTVVKITPKKDVAELVKHYQKIKIICNKTFNQRRKMLRNTLQGLFDSPEDILKQVGISGETRPEQLSPADFAALARFL